METIEKMLFSNSFGSVTDKRIILNYKGGTEDLPINPITSVGYKHSRNYVFAFGVFLICVGGLIAIISNLSYLRGIEVFVGFILVLGGLLMGVAHWIGNYSIQISAGGMDRKQLRVELSKTKEGREFVNAVKRAVIK